MSVVVSFIRRRALAVVVALTACAAPHAEDSEAAYLARRDQYRQEITQRADADADMAVEAESLALRDLEQRLRPVIGRFAVAGLTDSGRINLTTLISGDLGSGLADGLTFESPDGKTSTFVTTRGLLHAWLAETFANDSSVSDDPLEVLAHEQVYTFILQSDAAVVRYADLPVAVSRKRVLAAMLVDRAQDICLDCAPNTILVGVSAGDRIFVVDAPARDTIPVPPRCRDAAAADRRPADAYEEFRRHEKTDTILFDRFTRAEDERFADLKRCYGTEVRSDPRFQHLVAQALALVEALPDR